MERYLENGTPFQVFVGRPGAEVAITDTHWNLEDMFNQALEAGLTPRRVKEHADGGAGEKGGAGGRPSWLSVVFSPLPRDAADA